MPLLNLFLKKSKSPLKASTTNLSSSNVSSGDNEWVAVNTVTAEASPGNQQRPQRQQQPSSSFNGPTRVSNDDSIYDPPIRHSSLFPLQGEKFGVYRSTQSLPGHSDPDTRPASHRLSSSPPRPPVPSKKSFFNWVSSRERSHTTSSVKSTPDSGDQSFNLKSFRHVRPESPSFNYANSPMSATVLPRSPSPITPTLVPVPTSTLPPPPVSFQVTSRKPRPSPVSPSSSDISPQPSSSQNSPQPRIVAGAFRQAARRSTTSLALGDPVVSPGTGLEDAGTGPGLGALFFENDIANTTSILSSSPPKLSLLSFSNSTTDVSTIFNNTPLSRPPRSQPPPNLSNHPSSSNTYTQLNHSSASIPTPASVINLNSPVLPSSPTSGPTSVAAPTKPIPSSSKSFPVRSPKQSYVKSSSSEDSDSEEEESASDDSDSGVPGVSRKRTVRPRNITASVATTTSSTTNSALGRPRAATAASTSSRPGTIVLETSSPKADMSSTAPSASHARHSSLTDNTTPLSERFPVSSPTDGPIVPRPPSTFDAHPNGSARPRASASVGAIHPSAKEARASVVLANSRLSTATNLSTPKAMAKPLSRSAGSDTSESSESGSEKDSDEDAPLSKLVPPKRPGTSMSTYSTNSNSSLRTKPLVDLSSPSTFSGRPVGAPAPISREEEELPKPRILVDTAGRSSPNLKNSSPVIKAAPLPQQQQRLAKVPLSSASSMSSPSSSGASIAASSRGVGGASSDTSTSPVDRYPKYRSFANGAANLTGDNNGFTRPSIGTSSPKSSPNSPAVTLSPTTIPPTRPFLRRESPATSSTGDSSSGKVPLTPKDDNDTRRGSQKPSSVLSSSKDRHQRPTHGRKSSVTFEDDVPLADKGVKSSGNSHSKLKEGDSDAEEAKRRERRRGEARAAIELGKVVNGPPPVDDEEAIGLGTGVQAMWPQYGMQMPMQPMQAPVPMPMPPMLAAGGGGMGMGMQPQLPMAFPSPVPNNDPTFLAAHQQAMLFAKQAYQYAVAQQAMAAANDEWERSSTMTGFMPTNGYMNMGMRGSVMFPPAPVSMYAGSTGGGGSLINGFGGLGGGTGAWGDTRSVYGGSFGPTAPMGMRLSTYSSTDLSAFNPAMSAGPSVGNYSVGGGPAQGRLAQQRPGVRQRTRTAPSSPVPPSHAGAPPLPSPSKSAVRPRAPAPPSSFRGVPNQ